VAAWRRALFVAIWSAAWACALVSRALSYLAAGTLTREGLRRATASGWEYYGRRDEEILSGLLPWEQECYARHLKIGERILLIGCGTGRDLIALLRQGHRVEGLDLAPGALQTCRQMLDRLGLAAELHVGDVEQVAIPGPFDAFVFSWFCYGYVPGSRGRIDVLRKLGTALRPGGRIILSYLPADRTRRLPTAVARLTARLTRSDWRPELGDRISVSLPARDLLHFQHEFVDGEFEAEVAAAGLTLAHHRRGVEGVAVLTGDQPTLRRPR
jgi:SAM-dependent methyltransferase